MLERIPFTESIPKDLLRVLAHIQCNGGYVAGGYARYLVTGQPFGDIDVFTNGPAAFLNILKTLKHNRYLSNTSINKATKMYDHEVRSFVYNLNSLNKIPLQLIDKAVHPHKVIRDFDMTCCQIYADFLQGVCYADKKFLKDAEKRKMVFTGVESQSHRPSSHIAYRVGKYIDKGYTITRFQLFNIFRQVADKQDFIDCLDLECKVSESDILALKTIWELTDGNKNFDYGVDYF